MPNTSQTLPGYSARAHDAGGFRVVAGVNVGDPVGGPDDCEAGDVYRLTPGARSRKLMLSAPDQGAPQRIAPGSDLGAPGDALVPLAVLTFLAADGERLAIVTARHEASGTLLALPLSPLAPNIDYTLVDIGADAGAIRLADAICVSFAAGTLVTLPGGLQRPIESLAAGDMILTRDNGGQPVRWIGKATFRAVGGFAPVVIAAGILGNTGDLVVSPHHRIFLYQRGTRRLGATAEVLVQAKHLVDGERVWRRQGGFVDYYSLVFDRHEIIFAEGIAAESLMVNDETVRLLPADLADELRASFPGLRQSQHFGAEAGRNLVTDVARDALFGAVRLPRSD